MGKPHPWSAAAAALLVLCAVVGAAAQDRAYTPGDVLRMKAVSAPAVSPDGKSVAFVIVEQDSAANSSRSDIYLVGTDGKEGPRRITFSGKHNAGPEFSPDGKLLGFLTDRGGPDGSQVYLLPLDSPGEARKLTAFPGGVDDFVFAPDGRRVVFTARVYPDSPSPDSAAARDSLREATKMKARVHDHLLYRHWNSYWDGKATHLFRIDLAGGKVTDLTPGLQYDALNYWMASAGREFQVSADSRWVWFAGNQDPDKAVSYNTEVYRVPLDGGPVEKISRNPAADNCPRLSPDGARVAWRATIRPGYESDRYELVVQEMSSGRLTNLTSAFDRSVSRIFWSASGETLYFEAEDKGDLNLFSVPATGGPVREVISAQTGAGVGYHLNAQPLPDGKSFVFLQRPFGHTSELVRFDSESGRMLALTACNKELLARVYVPEGEEFFYPGAGGAPVHGMLFRPRGYDRSKKYPLLVRVHGGPQQMFGRVFRHEYALFAGAGYFVFVCNPRGSTGYGQEFTDQIRGDWGGRVIEDIRRGVRQALSRYESIDPARVAAWGDSYGGFVSNWLEGHNEDRMFATLVSHAGDADQWGAYGSTEELWFPEWELHGPPWESPNLYDKLSPIRYAGSFRTPMLLTAGDLDWRVPLGGSEQMFTALQRQGVPSRFIHFPDEGHWILKPQNQAFWYGSIMEWVNRWCKPE